MKGSNRREEEGIYFTIIHCFSGEENIKISTSPYKSIITFFIALFKLSDMTFLMSWASLTRRQIAPLEGLDQVQVLSCTDCLERLQNFFFCWKNPIGS